MPSLAHRSRRRAALIAVTLLAAACASRELTPSLLSDTLLVKQGVSFLALPRTSASKASPQQGATADEALWQTALQAARQQNWTLCEATSLQVLERRPYDPDTLALLAITYMSLDQLAKSTYFNELLLQQQPNSSPALNLKGLLLQHNAITLFDYQQAASHFQAAYASAPDELAAGLNLGYLYLELGNASRSAELFAELSARCPSCTTAKLGLGIAHNRLGATEKAQALFKEILAGSEAGHPEARYHLALTYLRAAQPNAALDLLLPLLAEVKSQERQRPSSQTSEFHRKLASLVARLHR